MRAIGIVLAGGNSKRMRELSNKRAIAAMPIAGSFRSVDFALSNMSNSHIQSVAVLFQPVYFYVKRKGSLVDTQVDLANTVKTKKALFQDYKELYDDLDMYEEHKLRIQAFYLEFARDGPRRPARPGREPGKKALKLKPFKKERSNDPERFEAGLPGLGHLFGLSGDRRDGALLADTGVAVGGAGVGAGGGAADGPGDAGPGADPGD